MEARKTENSDMENVRQKFLQSHFSQNNHKDFLEDVGVRLIVKTQGSYPNKRKYYWMRTLKTLYPDGLKIESDYLCSLGNIWSLAISTFSWEPEIVFYLKVLEIYCASCIL